MIRERAKELLPIITAYAEGKELEILIMGEWHKLIHEPLFDSDDTYRIKPEENYTIEQNCGENRIEGGVLSVSGSVNKEDDELWYVIFNMNMQYEICRKCPKSGLFSGTHEECEKWILEKWNEEHPEPKEKHYRPFKNCSEMIMTTGTKLIWVIHKKYGTENLITAFDNDNESIGGSCVFIQDMWIDMQELFENFTFCDGSPCGLEE